jgi:hypothetical protein
VHARKVERYLDAETRETQRLSFWDVARAVRAATHSPFIPHSSPPFPPPSCTSLSTTLTLGWNNSMQVWPADNLRERLA